MLLKYLFLILFKSFIFKEIFNRKIGKLRILILFININEDILELVGLIIIIYTQFGPHFLWLIIFNYNNN